MSLDCAIPGLFAIIAIAMVALSLFFASRRWKKWEKLADELGLKYGADTIFGVLDGVPVRLWTQTNGLHKKHRRTYTIAQVKLERSSLPLGLEITREDLLSKVGNVLTGGDIALGDDALDGKLLVRAAEDAEVRAWASDPLVLRGLQALLDTGEVFVVSDASVRIELSGAIDDARLLRKLLSQIVEIAPLLGTPTEDVATTPQWLDLGS